MYGCEKAGRRKQTLTVLIKASLRRPENGLSLQGLGGLLKTHTLMILATLGLLFKLIYKEMF